MIQGYSGQQRDLMRRLVIDQVAETEARRWGGGGDTQVPEGKTTPRFVLPSASTGDPDTTTWDINHQPEGYFGVDFTGCYDYYDTTAEKLYQFRRVSSYDSLGKLIAVSAETKYLITPFIKPCES